MAALPVPARQNFHFTSGDLPFELSGDDSSVAISSGCSTDMAVDVDVSDEDKGSEDSGSIGWSLAGQNVHGEASTSAINSGSNQLSTSLRLKHNSKLATYAAKFLDEKAPLRKKIKWLNRLANVKHDGTVQFDIPIDMKPHALDFGTDVICNEAPEKEHIDSVDIPEIPPPLQIVMLIVGTRGDVQPFVAIGKRLQADGHRVRLATHSNFKDFVTSAGLEFFPLGGDPKVLAGSEASPSPLPFNLFPDMVKNKGFLPSVPSEIPTQRQQLKEIIFSLLPACVGNDPDSNARFDVDAIIANPPAYDWGPKIDVVGFCFLDLASSYEPPDSLVKWLEDGKKPIYIGFGSLPVQEPERMTQIIVQALEKTGQRGIINKGWGGLGYLAEPKDFVYLLDNCPHDWLFLQCVAVVHHGGAGTTAAGLKAACPTTIVPFFGDQPFWGERVHGRGVGPAPIPVEELSLEKLVHAIHFMLDPEVRLISPLHSWQLPSHSINGFDAQVKRRAVELAKDMEGEDGVAGAVKAFYKHFPGKSPQHDPIPIPSSARLSLRRCFGYTP
ncbi:hypothetical protein V6N13_131560 [Hibiscus sabdariffa]